MTPPLDLDALRAANDARRWMKDAATPGPWRDRQSGSDAHRNVTHYVETVDATHGVAECNFTEVDNVANACFIAYVRNDPVEDHVAQLIAEVERLRYALSFQAWPH